MKWQHDTFNTLEPRDVFSATIVEQLKTLHINTFEDLFALTAIDSLRELLSKHLNFPPA